MELLAATNSQASPACPERCVAVTGARALRVSVAMLDPPGKMLPAPARTAPATPGNTKMVACWTDRLLQRCEGRADLNGSNAPIFAEGRYRD
jgi:hypothetical protein